MASTPSNKALGQSQPPAFPPLSSALSRSSTQSSRLNPNNQSASSSSLSASASSSLLRSPTGRAKVNTIPPFARKGGLGALHDVDDEDEMSEEFDDSVGHAVGGGTDRSKKGGATSRTVGGGEGTVKTPSSMLLAGGGPSGSGAGRASYDEPLSATSTSGLSSLMSTSQATNGDSTGRRSVDPLTPIPKAHHDDPRSEEAYDSRWWTFTLPTKYVRRVEDYMARDWGGVGTSDDHGGGGAKKEDGDAEKEGEYVEMDEKGKQVEMRPGIERVDSAKSGKSGRFRMGPFRMDTAMKNPHEGVLSLHHAGTPAWSAPWTPFKRVRSDPFHADLEALRMKEAATDGHPSGGSSIRATTRPLAVLRNFALHHTFAPLFFRFLNLAFTSTTLALAARIKVIEKQHGVEGIVGTSTLLAIIFAPFTIVHVIVAVYIEYFGRPIGIWAVSTKMLHTLTELIFICLWSAELSLAFDDFFTTPLACSSFTPGNTRYLPNLGSPNVEGSVSEKLCDIQGALVGLVFLGLMLYIAVLIVSLFRIFNKVSRKS